MAPVAAPDPHDDPDGGGAAAGRMESSTKPRSDTRASDGPLSGHTTDFGPVDRSTAGPDPLIGIDLGGIEIVRLIGEGGMGRVYEARQVHPARDVAVKLMRTPPLGGSALQRFRREADALARLRHPGIAQIHMAGCWRSGVVEMPYYVMELVPDALPLVEASNRLSLPLRERLLLLVAICDAVGHGHAAGVVHRDLKPGNILVDAAGRPKVIDFGLARMDDLGPADTAPRTDTGQFIGTRPYMAPEQFSEHRAAVDARTDVYAIGLVMHELLTGRLPYDVAGRSLVETARIVQGTRPSRLVVRAVRRDERWLADGADAIATRCLEKTPDARYPTAAAVAADLRRLLEDMPLATTQRGKRFPVRAAVGLAAVVVIAAVSGLAWSARSARPPTPDAAANRATRADRAEASPAGGAVPVATGRFARVSSGRTTPLEWVDLQFDRDVFALGPDDFRLTRDGEPVAVADLVVTGGPRSWRVVGLATLTAPAGEYVLAVVGTPESPVDGTGAVVAVSGETRWRSPAFREIRFSPRDDDWDRHLVSLDGVERYTEQKAGATTFIRPTVAGREGSATWRFDLPFAVQDATLAAPLAVWTTGDPFPYDPGARASLDVSPDGAAWTTLVDLKAGSGGFNGEVHDIGRIVAGSTRIWVRARLTATREWPGDGLIFAQFLRTDPAEPGEGFRLTATGPHPPVIPQGEP